MKKKVGGHFGSRHGHFESRHGFKVEAARELEEKMVSPKRLHFKKKASKQMEANSKKIEPQFGLKKKGVSAPLGSGPAAVPGPNPRLGF